MSTQMYSLRQEPESMSAEAAFTSAQVLRLTGISKRQLDYWIGKGIVTADIDQAVGRGRVRLFSFANLVEIRTAAWLRDKVSLQLIAKIVSRLRTDSPRPLTELTFGIFEARPGVYDVILKPIDGVWEEWRSGQKIIEIAIPIETFASELRRSVDEERSRSAGKGSVEKRRGVLGSAPVVAGTRIPTSTIWNLHKSGYDCERIIQSYPDLSPEDVEAALSAEKQRRNPARAG